MVNVLTTYLLHSTVLLTTMWLTLRIVHPRSPVLVERLWKIAAVLPVITAMAMAMMCRPASDPSDVRVTVRPNDVPEALVESVADKPARATAVSVVPISDDDWPLVRLIEPWHETDQPLDVPSIEWRIGTLVRPPDDEPIPDGTSKSPPPPAVFDRSTELASSEPAASEAAEADELVIAESIIVADVEAHSPRERAEPWLLPAWQFASALLPAWAVLGVVWLVIRSVWFRWRLRNARCVERGRAVDVLRKLSSLVVPPLGGAVRSRLKAELRTRLLIVPGFAEPAAFGIWRPTIVLPPSCESLDRDALRAVLAHELGHIARGDVWWLMIGRVLTTILGFQPLNRIARREWTCAAECLCDDWAVGRGVERLTLARCLTALAEHRLTGVSLADALAAVGSPSSLRLRVERLVAEPAVDPWSNRSRRWLITSVVAVVAAVIAMTLPLPEFASARAIADDEPDAALIGEIEAELSGLRTELQHAAQLAEERGDPLWLDAAESLRQRERRIVERWQLWKSE